MPDMASIDGNGGEVTRGNTLANVENVQEALAFAMGGNSVQVLRAAIAIARSQGIDDANLVDASERLAVLEDEAQITEAAEERLLQAVEAVASGTSSTQALAIAIEHAAGIPAIDRELLEEARRNLESRRVFEVLQAGERGAHARAVQGMSAEDAEKSLAEAAARDDVRALEVAIAQAEASGVCEESLSAAREGLEVIRELALAKSDAEEALINAMCGKCDRLLEAAIVLAEEAGVAEHAISIARAKLSSVGDGEASVRS